MRRNADGRLRALERKLEAGDDEDALAYLGELARSGAMGTSDGESDLRPSLQKKILGATGRLALKTEHRDDIERHMMALRYFTAGITGELVGAISIALLERGVDPVTVWHLSGEDSIWDDFIGPMLDDMEERAGAAEIQDAVAQITPAVAPLQDRRRIAADIAAGNFDFGDEESIFFEWGGGWQSFSNSDVWHRVVYLQPTDDNGDPVGDSFSRTLSVQFAPRSDTVVESYLST